MQNDIEPHKDDRAGERIRPGGSGKKWKKEKRKRKGSASDDQ